MTVLRCKCSHGKPQHTSGAGKCWSGGCGCVVFRPDPGPRPVEPFLSVAEAASQLRVSKMTVYRLVHARVIPANRIGHQFRIRERDLDRYIRETDVSGWVDES